MENNYPERIYKCFVLNNNLFTLIVWKFIKPFVQNGTIKKVYDSDHFSLKMMSNTLQYAFRVEYNFLIYEERT